LRLKPLPIIFHLIPLVPLWMHWPYVTIAAFILVGVPYIKVRKLSAQLADLVERHPLENASRTLDERQRLVLEKEKSSLERTIRLWHALTLF
jgi:hypothetical protein